MALTERERAIVDLLRADPLLDAGAIADRLGSTRAAVSVHLSNLGRKGVVLGRGYVLREETGSVVVVGAANVDITARAVGALERHTSNPGHQRTGSGGVGRNIAENLARLGTPTRLVAPVGRDDYGTRLLEVTRAAGVAVDDVIRTDAPTGTYLAVLDADGDLLVAVCDMAGIDDLTVPQVEHVRRLLPGADLLVLDGNLPAGVAAWLVDSAAAAEIPVVLDPVSVPKARDLAPVLTPQRPVLALTPNHDELEALVGYAVERTRAGVVGAAADLHDRGVTHVWVRRGTLGSLLSTRAAPTDLASVTELPAPPAEVVDVTGAGDSMTAAFVHAILRGDGPVAAAAFGQAAAALTVASAEAVRPDLTAALVDELLTATHPTATGTTATTSTTSTTGATSTTATDPEEPQ